MVLKRSKSSTLSDTTNNPRNSNIHLVNKRNIMKINKLIYKTATIASYILTTILIIMIFLKITNHSPTIDQIILTLLGAIIMIMVTMFGMIMKNHSEISKLKVEVRHINLKLDSIGHDLKKHIFKT